MNFFLAQIKERVMKNIFNWLQTIHTELMIVILIELLKAL